jgi:mevalonate pyrophosphate decarboxylase
MEEEINLEHHSVKRFAIGKTSIAPNIATIKYWGKLEQEFNIPLNGSISYTLDRDLIRSSTEIRLVEPAFKSEKTLIDNVSFMLNGKEEPFVGKHKTGLNFFLE